VRTREVRPYRGIEKHRQLLPQIARAIAPISRRTGPNGHLPMRPRVCQSSSRGGCVGEIRRVTEFETPRGPTAWSSKYRPHGRTFPCGLEAVLDSPLPLKCGSRCCIKRDNRLEEARWHEFKAGSWDTQAANACRDIVGCFWKRGDRRSCSARSPGWSFRTQSGCKSGCKALPPSSIQRTEKPRFRGFLLVAGAGFEPATSGL
jgi:hypothetical protein